MSMLTQSCLFTAQNAPLFDASQKRRVTQQDVGNALLLAPNTVDRCLKGIGSPETIAAVMAKAEELGYKRVDKWQSVKPEFILGYDNQGRPKIDERAICILRERGNHARNIKTITGLSRKKIKKILEENGLNTKNLQRIEENGLSLRQRQEKRAIEIIKKRQTREQAYLQKGSELRKITLNLIRLYKNGIGIETAARKLGVSRSDAFWCMYKSKAYKIIKKNKTTRSDYYKRLQKTKTFSTKYPNETSMLYDVLQELSKKYPNGQILKEYTILETFSSHAGQRGYRADFAIFRQGLNPIAVEVKNKTTSCSFKNLFGQVLCYKAAGFDVECVIPADALCPNFAREVLSKNNVKLWTV